MKKILLLCFSFALVLNVWAQDRVVSGKVTSAEDGSALPGVSVLLKGTTNGTVTDAEGNYKLTIAGSGGTLVFSFIGMTSSEVEIGERAIVDVSLGLDVKQLSEVVVTSQGILREQKALGYAQTTISSQLLANKPETDVGRALQGRTPGLQILNSSGLAGSSSRVNIRGNSSITGDTQPLWVVDGVPINTQSNDINQSFRDGQVAPSRFLDIDPNNIESISVLRGLNATTLYGSQGRNGVILVSTKTGSNKGTLGKLDGSVSQSYFVVEAILPEYQNKWGNGFDGYAGEYFSNWGLLFNGKGQGLNHPYYEWRNIFPDHPEFAISKSTVNPDGSKGYTPQAYPNNVSDFFKKGYSSTTSFALGTKTEFGSLKFNYSHLDETGFVKFNDVKRDNFSLGGNAKLSAKLSLKSTFNFVRTEMQTPPVGAGTGSNSIGGPSIWANLFYTPRNVDLTNWPWENPLDHSSVYYRNGKDIVNPYWTLNNARQTDITNRFFSSSSLSYQFNEDLSATYRLGYDTYSEQQQYWVNKGALNGFDQQAVPGLLRTTSGLNTIIDHSFLINYSKKVNKDVNVSAIIGANYRANSFSQTGLESLGQVVYGLLEHRNFSVTQSRTYDRNDGNDNNLNYTRKSNISGIFFDANIDYKDWVYFSFSGRNDWSSNLQGSNASLFYPGASISFLPTSLFTDLAPKIIDLIKVRAAFGSSANFGTPYRTVPYLTINSQARQDYNGQVITLRNSDLLANPDLKPELLQETEIGLESQLFQNRIRFNASYYIRNAKNQIIKRPLDPSSGNTETYINAGLVSNKGLELSLGLVPIKSADWTWEITANFTKNVSKVESLPEGSKQILVNGFSNLGNFAIEGQPLNVIQGKYREKTPDGKFIVAPDGNYKVADNIGIIANPNPNWLGSIITTLSYKQLSIGTQWDYVSGGQVYSYTAQTMIGRGVGKDLESFDPTLPLLLPGVNEVFAQDGTVSGYTPNKLPLTTAGVFYGNSLLNGALDDVGIYDATRVRFREVSLSYQIPSSIASKLKLTSLNISFVGSNLWYRAINAPKYAKADFDRTAFGTNNGAGFDYLGGPSAKRYGVNIKINF